MDSLAQADNHHTTIGPWFILQGSHQKRGNERSRDHNSRSNSNVEEFKGTLQSELWLRLTYTTPDKAGQGLWKVQLTD
jgi:hypothetical protein